jgi:hypothetical protein
MCFAHTEPAPPVPIPTVPRHIKLGGKLGRVDAEDTDGLDLSFVHPFGFLHDNSGDPVSGATMLRGGGALLQTGPSKCQFASPLRCMFCNTRQKVHLIICQGRLGTDRQTEALNQKQTRMCRHRARRGTRTATCPRTPAWSRRLASPCCRENCPRYETRASTAICLRYHVIYETRAFCQDRLGTNTGKALKKERSALSYRHRAIRTLSGGAKNGIFF